MNIVKPKLITLVIVLAIVAYLVLGGLAATWLAGALYYLLNKAVPHHITLSTWLAYWHWYGQSHDQGRRLVRAAIVACIVVFVVPGFIVAQVLSGKGRSLHGDARFATLSEIRKVGLFGSNGIIVGKLNDKYLIFGGQQFVLLAAPTRSGKGVAVVLPNLLNFSGSVVVLDIKLENFKLSSRFRAGHGQAVFLFNPFAEDFKTHRWNPLDSINRDRNYRVGDIQAIGQALYPGSDRDGFWNDQARNLFLGLVLYLLDTPSLPCTMGETLRQSSGKGLPLRDYLQGLIKARSQDGNPLSDECLDALARFCATSDNTLTSILATFNAPLTIFANPIVDAATSQSDFDIARVRQELMSIYIGIQPNRLADASLLINLFFSQIINLNTKELPQNNRALKHPCLLILDEFTSLGRVGVIATSNAFIAGYNLRLLTIVQSVAQLESVYGEKDGRTLVTNHALQIIFPPREQADATAYSEMLGYYSEKAVSKGVSNPRGSGQGGSSSENTSDQRRALMLPQELKEMDQNEQIILLENAKPIRCVKACYYDDATFIDRLKSVSPALAALKKDLPTRDFFEHLAFVRAEFQTLIPALDVGLYKAKVEKRIRDIKPGEVIEAARLTVDVTKLPSIDDQDNPSIASASAIADAFGAQIGMTSTGSGGSHGASSDAEAKVVLNTQLPVVTESNSIEELKVKKPRRRALKKREAGAPIDLSLLSR